MINFNKKEIETIQNIFNHFINADEEFMNGDFYKSEINDVISAIDQMDNIITYEEANKNIVSVLINIYYFPFANQGFDREDLKEYMNNEEISIYEKIYNRVD